MKKYFGVFFVLSCLSLGCNSNSASNVTDDGHVTDNVLVTNNSEVTLYYDIPQTVKLDLKEGDAELKIVGNNCIDILTESPVTDAKGIVTLEIKAKQFNCENGKKVKVCIGDEIDPEDDKCIEFTVRTTSDDETLDANHNLMFDMYETNKDKDKFANYEPGKCDSFCHDDGDCEDFCDSAIGYRCSTRCTRDDQCIKYKDDNGDWIQMVCREDGRCAYPSFLVIYDIGKDNTTVTMGGHPASDDVTIDWGDKSEVQTIPADTENNLSHTYAKAGRYEVKITGEYDNWTAGCKFETKQQDDKTIIVPIVDVYDISQFGPIGLGYVGNHDDVDEGAFRNCSEFNKISARDIPDSIKLTDMSSMFAGHGAEMHFDDPAITRWDTSNVKSMFHTFLNGGEGSRGKTARFGFNQDIGRWDTSNVTNMNGLFNSAPLFNQKIQCWNTSNVEDVSYMFLYDIKFNQNLENWNLDKVTKHECVFRYENGHNGNISFKNYCIFRSLVNNENIGRDGDRSDKVRGDCHDIIESINEYPFVVPFHSTCCGNGGGVRPEDWGIYVNLCSPGYDYGTSCDRDNWREVVNRCLEKYLHLQDSFKDLTEDTTTCMHLRTARDCYYECHKCYYECHENHQEPCDCERTYYEPEKFWCTCQGMDNDEGRL